MKTAGRSETLVPIHQNSERYFLQDPNVKFSRNVLDISFDILCYFNHADNSYPHFVFTFVYFVTNTNF
jgi:hypothetical protein